MILSVHYLSQSGVRDFSGEGSLNEILLKMGWKGKGWKNESREGTRHLPSSHLLWSAVKSSPRSRSSELPSVSGVICFLRFSLTLTFVFSALSLLLLHCIPSSFHRLCDKFALFVNRWCLIGSNLEKVLFFWSTKCCFPTDTEKEGFLRGHA